MTLDVPFIHHIQKFKNQKRICDKISRLCPITTPLNVSINFDWFCQILWRLQRTQLSISPICFVMVRRKLDFQVSFFLARMSTKRKSKRKRRQVHLSDRTKQPQWEFLLMVQVARTKTLIVIFCCSWHSQAVLWLCWSGLSRLHGELEAHTGRGNEVLYSKWWLLQSGPRNHLIPPVHPKTHCQRTKTVETYARGHRWSIANLHNSQGEKCHQGWMWWSHNNDAIETMTGYTCICKL